MAEENGQPGSEEENRAPWTPWEIAINQMTVNVSQFPGGIIELQVTPAILYPDGSKGLAPPAVKIRFGHEGWEEFKRTVNGAKVSQIEVVSSLP